MNDRPRVGVLGCGHWGKNLVRNFHALGALARIGDVSDAGRACAAQLAPNVPVETEAESLLARHDIDAVVIATPAETHYDLTLRALSAGKDVFVEKPMALRREDAEQMVELAKGRGRILMVGHVLEYHPAIRRIGELCAAGELGKIHYLYSNRLNLGKIRREENILWSFAPHDIAVILRLTGAMPLEVVACGGAYIQANIADVTVTNMLFDHGVRAHIYVSWLHPFKEQRLVVVGSRAMVSFDGVAKKLIWYDQRVELSPEGPMPIQGGGKEIAFDAEEPLRLECQAFLRALETRQAPLTDGVAGLATLRVLQATQRSLMTNGQPVLMDRL